MKVINMTPHPVKLRGMDGLLTTIQPSGSVARVTLREQRVGVLGSGIPLFKTEMADITSLPPEAPGVLYIVSSVVKNVAGRGDLVVPCHLKRNDHGIVIEARGLSM